MFGTAGGYILNIDKKKCVRKQKLIQGSKLKMYICSLRNKPQHNLSQTSSWMSSCAIKWGSVQ